MRAEIYVAAAVLPALTLAAAHWFPWGALPGRGGAPLPRLATYAIGVAVIVGYTSLLAWSGARAAMDALALLWIVAASAGATTLAAWWIDDWTAAHAAARAGKIIEKAARSYERQ